MILVLGDAMIDRYWTGDVTRISPEAPVPVVTMTEEEDRHGGAANVAKNIEAMGGNVRLLASASYDSKPIIKLRIARKKQHMLRVDWDTKQEPISLDALDAAMEYCDLVVLEDYGKGALGDLRHATALIERIVSSGRTLLVDPKGYRYEKYRGAALVKPNLDEMKEMVGGWENEGELTDKVIAMRKQAGIRSVLLTRGAGGMTLYDEARTNVPANTMEVIDPSGAGETAISAFAVAISEGRTFPDAARYANKAAGIAVSRFGTTVVSRAEVFG